MTDYEGEKAVHGSYAKSIWWRRRESNPRPKALLSGVYMCIPSFSSRMIKRRWTGFSSPHPLFSRPWSRGAARDQPAVRRSPQNTGNFEGACCVNYAASASSLLAFVFVSIFLRGDGATTCNLSLITPVEPFRPRLEACLPAGRAFGLSLLYHALRFKILLLILPAI